MISTATSQAFPNKCNKNPNVLVKRLDELPEDEQLYIIEFLNRHIEDLSIPCIEELRHALQDGIILCK